MNLYLSKEEQVHYTGRQLSCFFPCGSDSKTEGEIEQYISLAYERLEYCFSRVKNRYYHQDGKPFFSPLITDQYATFLYLLANTVFSESQNRELDDRLYALNKALHGLDIYYEVELPKIFLLVHTVGTVLGRAQYEDYLVVYQGVTVGGNLNMEYPTIGKSVGLFANSKVVGNSVIGDGTAISAGALLVDCSVPEGQVCFGMYPENHFKPSKRRIAEHYFHLEEGE